MAYCEGQSEARVFFKYPNREEENFLSTSPPVDYQLETINSNNSALTQGQCECVAYSINYHVRAQDFDPNKILTTRILGKIGGTIAKPSSIASYYKLGFICRGYYGQACQAYPYEFLIHSAKLNSDGTEPFIQIISITRIDGLADNCGGNQETECKFTITDTRGIVYTRTEKECPQVRIECGKKCPLNTCECRCGNMICCYNAQGYAIYSFPANT